MTNYFARPRRQLGRAFKTLTEDHARKIGTEVESLQEIDDMIQEAGARQVVILQDRPSPAMGYAQVFQIADDTVGVRLHLLDGAPVQAARALFSQVLVQSRVMTGIDDPVIVIDGDQLSAASEKLIAEQGGDYSLSITAANNAVETPEQHEIADQSDDPAKAEVNTLEEVSSPEIADSDAEEGEAEDMPPLPEPLAEEFACEDCGKSFDSERGLSGHRRVHK